MDYLKYKDVEYPVRVSYYALKQYQVETGRGIESLDEELSNLEILLYHALVAGAKADNKGFNLDRSEIEFMLDECMNDFNAIMINSFATSDGKESSDKKK